MSLSIALNTAVRALQVNQAAIDVTSQNVANVNTEGYSRKIVQQEAVVVAGSGQGVEITAIARRVNEFILKDYRNAISEASASGVENDFYSRMQDLFSSIDDNISTYLCSTLGEAVTRGFEVTTKGDVLLLSPGCASMDMFKDYKDRGEKFRKAVMDRKNGS